MGLVHVVGGEYPRVIPEKPDQLRLALQIDDLNGFSAGQAQFIPWNGQDQTIPSAGTGMSECRLSGSPEKG